MPCYQIIQNSVEFKVENIDLLKIALVQLKLSIREEYNGDLDLSNGLVINLKNGKISSTSQNEVELSKFSNSLKREYSKAVIDEIGRKNKWHKKQLNDKQFQLQRF